jgi:hypothetical protein
MVEISHIICERLEYIKLSPSIIVNVSNEVFFSFSTKFLQDVYPDATIIKNINNVQKSDFIFGVLYLESDEFFQQFSTLLFDWRNHLVSGGLLMLGLLNPPAEIFEIGDCLTELGYKDVVIDKERLDENHTVVCIHAWKAIPASVAVSQIRRL